MSPSILFLVLDAAALKMIGVMAGADDSGQADTVIQDRGGFGKRFVEIRKRLAK